MASELKDLMLPSNDSPHAIGRVLYKSKEKDTLFFIEVLDYSGDVARLTFFNKNRAFFRKIEGGRTHLEVFT